MPSHSDGPNLFLPGLYWLCLFNPWIASLDAVLPHLGFPRSPAYSPLRAPGTLGQGLMGHHTYLYLGMAFQIQLDAKVLVLSGGALLWAR